MKGTQAREVAVEMKEEKEQYGNIILGICLNVESGGERYR